MESWWSAKVEFQYDSRKHIVVSRIVLIKNRSIEESNVDATLIVQNAANTAIGLKCHSCDTSLRVDDYLPILLVRHSPRFF